MKKTINTKRLSLRTEHIVRLSTIRPADLGNVAGASGNTDCEVTRSADPDTCTKKP